MREIRRARPEDARGIAQVHVQSWKETYTGQIDAAFLAERSEEKSLRAFEKDKGRNMVIALEQGEITGFAAFGSARDGAGAGEVRALYVLQKAQGGGTGKALLHAALQGLRDMGFSKAVLWVLATNHKAIGFYRHEGFAWDGTEKQALLGTPVTEHRYLKEL